MITLGGAIGKPINKHLSPQAGIVSPKYQRPLLGAFYILSSPMREESVEI